MCIADTHDIDRIICTFLHTRSWCTVHGRKCRNLPAVARAAMHPHVLHSTSGSLEKRRRFKGVNTPMDANTSLFVTEKSDFWKLKGVFY